MSSVPLFQDALARLREVFAFYRKSPSVVVNSLELQDCTRDAARVAMATRVPFAALCAELGRAATESLPDDPLAAIGVGRTMTRWAAEVYHARAAAG